MLYEGKKGNQFREGQRRTKPGKKVRKFNIHVKQVSNGNIRDPPNLTTFEEIVLLLTSVRKREIFSFRILL